MKSLAAKNSSHGPLYFLHSSLALWGWPKRSPWLISKKKKKKVFNLSILKLLGEEVSEVSEPLTFRKKGKDDRPVGENCVLIIFQVNMELLVSSNPVYSPTYVYAHEHTYKHIPTHIQTYRIIHTWSPKQYCQHPAMKPKLGHHIVPGHSYMRYIFSTEIML